MDKQSSAAVNVALDYTSAGVNRVVNALDWGPLNLIAYASHHTVVVYHVEDAKILSTIKGHKDQVTCLKWINVAGDDAWLLSGSADSSIRCWHWNGTNALSPWTCTAVLQGHSAGVSSLCLYHTSPTHVLLVSTAGEQVVLLWEGSCSTVGGEWEWAQVQQLQSGGGAGGKACVPLCTSVSHLPGKPDWLVLAVGGTDMAVRLYVRPPGGVFEMGCKLLGAESWIRALAFTMTNSAHGEGDALVLASACQDRYLRVWVVEQEDTRGSSSAAPSGPAPTTALSRITRFASKPTLKAGDVRYIASLEGVLLGHEDWVHSVCWQHSGRPFSPAHNTDGSQHPMLSQQRSELRLLSASMDRTMIIWAFDERCQLWMNQSSVGDAGATCLGYYGGVFSPDGNSIVAHGFTGALHLWSWDGSRRQWVARHALGGHWAPVTDCSWGADGKCVVTVSADQTARIFTRVNGHWCEMARPQVHGHDLRCVACLPSSSEAASRSGSYIYASGSEEKVIRVFEAPQAFLDTLAMARGQTPSSTVDGTGTVGDRLSLGAALPALGLSNKAVYQHGAGQVNGGVGSGMDGGSYTEGPDFVPCASPSAVSGPPLEEHLAQNTLWPEVHKLYGHGNDLFCLAADPLGRFVASACVSKTASTANIWIWSTNPWKAVCERPGHTLTVKQMEFSHDGQYLLSASRDRSFCIYRVGDTDTGTETASSSSSLFQLTTKYKSAHARVIWGVSWTPDDRVFATCSRDQTIKFWAHQPAESPSASTPSNPASGVALLHVLQLEKNASPCAVAFAPLVLPSSEVGAHRYLLAVGKEDGTISLHDCAWSSSTNKIQCSTLWESTDHMSHAAAITRLRWRLGGSKGQEPASGMDVDDTALQLATSSSDHSLRIFTVTSMIFH